MSSCQVAPDDIHRSSASGNIMLASSTEPKSLSLKFSVQPKAPKPQEMTSEHARAVMNDVLGGTRNGSEFHASA